MNVNPNINRIRQVVGIDAHIVFSGTSISTDDANYLNAIAKHADVFVAIPYDEDLHEIKKTIEATLLIYPELSRRVRWGVLEDVLEDDCVTIVYSNTLRHAKGKHVRIVRGRRSDWLYQVYVDVYSQHVKNEALYFSRECRAPLQALETQRKKQECVKHEVKRPPERVALLLASMNPVVIEPALPGFVKLANEAADYLREAIAAGVWSDSKTDA